MVQTRILSKPERLLWSAAGYALLGLGIAGYVLPVMPGTIFLILALACFARSNDRMVEWMLAHPWFGRVLGEWLRTGSISTKVKWISCGCIAVFSVASAWRAWSTAPLASVAVMMVAVWGVTYIVRRPTL